MQDDQVAFTNARFSPGTQAEGKKFKFKVSLSENDQSMTVVAEWRNADSFEALVFKAKYQIQIEQNKREDALREQERIREEAARAAARQREEEARKQDEQGRARMRQEERALQEDARKAGMTVERYKAKMQKDAEAKEKAAALAKARLENASVYVLRDGRRIKALNSIEADDSFTLQDEAGKFVEVKKKYIVEIQKPGEKK